MAACPVCARAKGNSQCPQGLLQPLPVPHRPWSHIAVDFVTGLPESQGSSVILMIVDRFSKSAHFVVLPKLPSVKETAQLLVQHVFRLHGLPLEVTSDRGPQLTSVFWKGSCTLVGVRPQPSSGFHPQTNGQTKRLNQQLEKSQHCLVEGSPSSWAASLPWVEYAYNSLPVSSTAMSPFACCLGYQPPIFPEEEKEVGVPAARALVLGESPPHLAPQRGGGEEVRGPPPSPQYPNTWSGRRYGFLPGTSLYAPPVPNWPPVSLVPSLSPESSLQPSG